jgi:hypothetical protein
MKKKNNIKSPDVLINIQNERNDFIVENNFEKFEKIVLAKYKKTKIARTNTAKQIDLSGYIKQHPDYDAGFINTGELKIDCYHLQDDKRVVSKRGIQKALGIDKDKSGQFFESVLNYYLKLEFCPDNLKVEIEKVLHKLQNNNIVFVRKGAGGSQPLTHGFEDIFFIEICHLLQDLKVAGILRPQDNIFYINANIIERAFSKLGIRAYIDEATGYIKHKKQNEYAELFKNWVLEEAGEYEAIFRDEYYRAIWRVWLQQDAPVKYKKYSFFAYITREFVYKVLARKQLKYDDAALGVLLKELDEKNPDRKKRHHQFLNEVGRVALDRQIEAFITICDGVKNKTEFKKQFNKTFKMPGTQIDFDFE